MKKIVFNFEFPYGCPEVSIFGYKFFRVANYQDKVKRLQYLSTGFSEFEIPANTGEHTITAYVEIPENEKLSILERAESSTALSDILLLISIFTRRDVFAVDECESKKLGVILQDARIYQWGGLLQCSIPYKGELIESNPNEYDIGFEIGLNQIYELMRSEEWQKEYQKGYYLFLAREAFRRQTIESAFTQCWTIWEHLFAVFNKSWLSDNQIRNLPSSEKISYLFVKYSLADEINDKSRKPIVSLVKTRNRLIHFGKFPKDASKENAVLFVRLTEAIVAKSLGLTPSNVFNTEERIEELLDDE